VSRIGMRDFEVQECTLSRTWLSTGSWHEDTRRSLFRSFHGLVDVFESRHERWPVTVLEFLHDGISYSRRWKRLFGDKTIARLAREFVEEVVDQ
jgi:hypothetical protein